MYLSPPMYIRLVEFIRLAVSSSVYNANRRNGNPVIRIETDPHLSDASDKRSPNRNHSRCHHVVAATEENFDFEYRKKNIDDKDVLETTCKAKGLYPQPTLDISVK